METRRVWGDKIAHHLGFWRDDLSFGKMKKYTIAKKEVNTDAIYPPRKTTTPSGLVIVTELYQGTLGDFYAGARLIEQLRHICPSLKIAWFILDEYHSFNFEGDSNRVVLPDSIDVYQFYSKLDLIMAVVTATKKSNLVLHFPANEPLMSTLSVICDSPFLRHCTEYDYPYRPVDAFFSSPEKEEKKVKKAGLGSDALGIFIDRNVPPEHRVMYRRLSAPVKEMLGMVEGREEQYFESHALFLGYANTTANFNRVNNAIRLFDFFKVIMELTKIDPTVRDKTIIDCILPMEDGFDEFAEELQKHDIRFIYSWENRFYECCYGTNNAALCRGPITAASGEKILRVINLFPLAHQDMKDLEALSHPFSMCTGDQSLSDLLSLICKGIVKIPFYQVMIWKQGVAAGLLDQASSFPVLLQYFQHILRNIEEATGPIPLDHAFVAELICNKALRNEMLLLGARLLDQFDLGKNLFAYLENLAPRLFKKKSKEQAPPHPFVIATPLVQPSPTSHWSV